MKISPLGIYSLAKISFFSFNSYITFLSYEIWLSKKMPLPWDLLEGFTIQVALCL